MDDVTWQKAWVCALFCNKQWNLIFNLVKYSSSSLPHLCFWKGVVNVSSAYRLFQNSSISPKSILYFSPLCTESVQGGWHVQTTPSRSFSHSGFWLGSLGESIRVERGVESRQKSMQTTPSASFLHSPKGEPIRADRKSERGKDEGQVVVHSGPFCSACRIQSLDWRLQLSQSSSLHIFSLSESEKFSSPRSSELYLAVCLQSEHNVVNSSLIKHCSN